MPSNHLIFCHLLLLLPSLFPSIRVFYNELVLHIRWPKYWSFSFSSVQFSSIQSFSRVWLSATRWIAARQASLSITISPSSGVCKVYLVAFSHLLCHYHNSHQVIPSLTIINFPLASLTAKIRILGGGWDGGWWKLASNMEKKYTWDILPLYQTKRNAKWFK